MKLKVQRSAEEQQFYFRKKSQQHKDTIQTTVPVIMTLQKQLIKLSLFPVDLPLHFISCSLVGVSANPEGHSSVTSIIVFPFVSAWHVVNSTATPARSSVIFGKWPYRHAWLIITIQMKLIMLQNHNVIKALMVKQHTNIFGYITLCKRWRLCTKCCHVQAHNLHIYCVPILTLRCSWCI